MDSPYIKFFPRDWQGDAALQSCSIAARGLWIELMCIMAQGKPYGYLRLNGGPLTLPLLSTLVRTPENDVENLLKELENTGVFSRDNESCIYSRRMVKDFQLLSLFTEAGKRGGNPKLMKKKNTVKGRVKGRGLTHTGYANGDDNCIIPNPELVVTWAQLDGYMGVGIEEAKVFINVYAKTGGKDKNGNLVTNYRAALNGWKTRDGGKWKGNKFQQQPSNQSAEDLEDDAEERSKQTRRDRAEFDEVVWPAIEKSGRPHGKHLDEQIKYLLEKDKERKSK